LVNRVPAYLAGVKAMHVHLRGVVGNTDPIWQSTLRSSQTMVSYQELYILFNTFKL